MEKSENVFKVLVTDVCLYYVENAAEIINIQTGLIQVFVPHDLAEEVMDCELQLVSKAADKQVKLGMPILYLFEAVFDI